VEQIYRVFDCNKIFFEKNNIWKNGWKPQATRTLAGTGRRENDRECIARLLKPFTSKGLGGLALSMKTNYQTKPPQIMKTIITLIAAGFILNTSNVTAQSTASINNDGITAAEGKVPSLIISEVNFKALRNGYNVTWETQNQFNVASFELQISENNKNFSTVKRRTCGPEKRSKYQVQLSNTLILANPVFYRLKWVTMDGQVNYTESKQFTNDL